MGQLTLAQARVVNPVLTAVAQGYKQLDFVGGKLFPTVPVGQRAGSIITFGKEDFMLYATQRAPGENTKRLSFGYASGTYALLDYSMEGQLPMEVQEEAESQDNGFTIDMASFTIAKVLNSMGMRLEYAQAQLARNASNYGASNKVTLSGTSQWSDYSGTSNPITVISTAKEAIRQQTGKRPNVCVMGAQVFEKLKAHPVIVDRIKYTGRDIATTELLASLFGVAEVIVGESIYASDAGVFADIWGKDVVLAYTENSPLASYGTPSYGYTYNLRGYPQVRRPYFEDNSNSWYFPTYRVEAPVIAASTAGYLITNAIA